MRYVRILLVVASVLFALAGLPAVEAQQDEPYQPVTSVRLVEPQPGDWLMYRRTYNGWGYSPLDQISAANVADLVPVWSLSTGLRPGHESPPLVNGRFMFLTTPRNNVLAVDARTGELIWRYVRQLPDDLTHGHPTNRGAALYEDKVLSGDRRRPCCRAGRRLRGGGVGSAGRGPPRGVLT